MFLSFINEAEFRSSSKHLPLSKLIWYWKHRIVWSFRQSFWCHFDVQCFAQYLTRNERTDCASAWKIFPSFQNITFFNDWNRLYSRISLHSLHSLGWWQFISLLCGYLNTFFRHPAELLLVKNQYLSSAKAKACVTLKLTSYVHILIMATVARTTCLAFFFQSPLEKWFLKQWNSTVGPLKGELKRFCSWQYLVFCFPFRNHRCSSPGFF